MAKLTGTNPDQVPTNADLGTMAYQDKDNVSIAGGSINLKDNDKLQFGDGSDLQIYHDGSNSYIQDAGTGGLYIKASNNLYIDGNTTGDPLIFAQDNGPVRLYYDGSQKLATWDEGINVSGKILADDEVKIESTSGYGRIEIGGPSGAFIDLKSPFSDDYDGRLLTDGASLYLTTSSDIPVMLKHNDAEKVRTTSSGISVTGSVELNGWTVTESGGSLYFATGGSNKMKLDASGNLDVVGSVNSNATIS